MARGGGAAAAGGDHARPRRRVPRERDRAQRRSRAGRDDESRLSRHHFCSFPARMARRCVEISAVLAETQGGFLAAPRRLAHGARSTQHTEPSFMRSHEKLWTLRGFVVAGALALSCVTWSQGA